MKRSRNAEVVVALLLLVFGAVGMLIYEEPQQAVRAANPGDKPPAEQPPGDKPPSGQAPTEKAPHGASIGADDDLHRPLHAALDQDIELHFQETPLEDAAAMLAAQLKVAVRLRRTALNNAGVAVDAPVSLDIKGVSARSALRLLLRPLGATYMVRDGMIQITTPEEAEMHTHVRLYPVAEFVVGDQPVEFDTLIELITSTIEPESWDEVGGPGSIEPYSASLVISQVGEVHEQIETLLGTLRKLRLQLATPGAHQPVALEGAQIPASINKALSTVVNWEFVDQPLKDVARDLQNMLQVPVVLDAQALEDGGLEEATPITDNASKTALRFALRAMLEEAELAFTVKDEVLLITTPEVVESSLLTRVYPVPDIGRDHHGALMLDDLSELLTSAVEPDTWDEVGGPGSCEQLTVHGAPTLVISQTWEVHRTVEKVLQQLRAARQMEQRQADLRKLPNPQKQVYLSLYRLDPGPDHPNESLTGEAAEELLLRLLPKDFWDQQGRVMIRVKSGLLIRHDAQGHQTIAKLFNDLATQGIGPGSHGGYGGFGSGFH